MEECCVSLEQPAEDSNPAPPVPHCQATLLSCVSAVGQALPPFIVYQGKQLDHDVLEEALPGTEVRNFHLIHFIQGAKG